MDNHPNNANITISPKKGHEMDIHPNNPKIYI
jgi:hypothetical protein